MGDRESLGELRSPSLRRIVLLLHHEAVYVEVKATALHQHQREAKDHDRGKKTKLEILHATKKIVKVSVILGPRTDCDQQSREHKEDATTNGTGLKAPAP
jgi:hypothetical protein